MELHAIAARKEEGGGEFAVAMTAEEKMRFLRGIKADYKEYYTMLGTVNAERSECSRPADRLSILKVEQGDRKPFGSDLNVIETVTGFFTV